MGFVFIEGCDYLCLIVCSLLRLALSIPRMANESFTSVDSFTYMGLAESLVMVVDLDCLKEILLCQKYSLYQCVN